MKMAIKGEKGANAANPFKRNRFSTPTAQKKTKALTEVSISSYPQSYLMAGYPNKRRHKASCPMMLASR